MAGTPDDAQIARQQRFVAFVLAGTIVAWMGVQWLGGVMGWDVRYAFLADLAALAGFGWALAVTYQIWRKRRG